MLLFTEWISKSCSYFAEMQCESSNSRHCMTYQCSQQLRPRDFLCRAATFPFKTRISPPRGHPNYFSAPESVANRLSVHRNVARAHPRPLPLCLWHCVRNRCYWVKTKLLLAASAVNEIMVAIDAMMDGANTSMNEHEWMNCYKLQWTQEWRLYRHK